MIRRRTLVAALGGPAAIWPFVAQAQQPDKSLREVGVLVPYDAPDDFNEQLRLAFNDTGLIDGRNIRFLWRYADGDIARLPALAAGLAALKLVAIVVIGAPAIRAMRQASATIPVIAGSDDLVGEGLVGSLGRTGGTITGWSILGSELNTKRLELLKSMMPAARRFGVLWDPDTGMVPLDALHGVAANLGVELQIEEVRRPEDLDLTFTVLKAWRAEALNVLASPLLHALRPAIISRAARDRLPAIYQWGDTVAAGGLMSYGPTHFECLHGMARQLDQVLKGAKAGDLPVEQPTKFELVINLKTAKALGLTIPPMIVARADEVIE